MSISSGGGERERFTVKRGCGGGPGGCGLAAANRLPRQFDPAPKVVTLHLPPAAFQNHSSHDGGVPYKWHEAT